jgi:hypothetical protein
LSTHTHTQERNRSRTILAFAALAALLLMTLLVSRASTAAFTADATSTGNFLKTGEIALGTHDGSGETDFGTIFAVDNMLPGQEAQRCVVVSYAGPDGIDANVDVTAALNGATGLESYLDFSVEVIDDASGYDFAGVNAGFDCDGFTDAADSTPYVAGTLDAFATAGSADTPFVGGAAEDTKVFRLTATLQNQQDAMGEEVDDVTLTWTATTQ